jgi:hypothetical protein
MTNEWNDWQPAVLKPIDKVTCELHRKLLAELPPDVVEQRSQRIGKPLKIRPCRVVLFGHTGQDVPNDDCYPVRVMDESGLVAGAFSCEFYTD